ncbi:unannotated protein [freshwater metagenome]|uniref:Unannotated protein n=1 Tax=freshwater metagenome TaxID=449393 RepID=A0A6J6J0R6_9ZZZZ
MYNLVDDEEFTCNIFDFVGFSLVKVFAFPPVETLWISMYFR